MKIYDKYISDNLEVINQSYKLNNISNDKNYGKFYCKKTEFKF